VRAYDLGLMEADFELQHGWAYEREKPVFHGVLSFPAGEDPGDEKMVEIARKYLKEIDMWPTQYAIVKHKDTAHLHLHIIANRVSNDGTIIGEGLLIERGIKAAQKLTEEYKLMPNHGKNLKLTNLEALHEPDAKRYRIYQAIKAHLPGCRNMEDLEKRLLAEGISMRYRYDPASGERQGISFRYQRCSFKGSRVDKEFSLRKLERTIALQQRQGLSQDDQQELLQSRKQQLRQDFDEHDREVQSREQRQRHRLSHGL